MLVSQSPRLRVGNVLATIPSTYGALTWLLSLTLYSLRILPWYPSSAGSELLLWGCGAAFVLSGFCSYLPYRHWLSRVRREVTIEELQRTSRAFTRTLLVMHLVGLVGIGMYVYDFSRALGGMSRFLDLLVRQSYMIRWQAEYTKSAGTQLSYFGWPAMAITIVLCLNRQLPRKWLIWAGLQFVGNCLFIGRTRPVWLLLTSVLLLAPLASTLSLQRIVYRAALIAGAISGLFVAMGIWVGKISAGIVADPNSSLPGTVQNLYLYMTAGFAYFDGIFKGEVVSDVQFHRSAYPLYRFFALLGFDAEPPSQINDFLWLPFSTNVGTALEPFYRDGGVAGAILGIVLLTIGTDLLALWLWNSNRLLSWFAAANLCFGSAMAFFTPKLNSLPVWIFIGMGALAVLGSRRSSAAPSGSPGAEGDLLPAGYTLAVADGRTRSKS